MNVLSVFDGMSCGQLALERAGIRVDNYFASEIDKWAISVTQRHYPNTIQLGTVLDWESWNLPKIDLLIGGSPCQGFSNAGKGLNFDDPRSKLFFVYVGVLKELKRKNPDLKFLLENVRMKQEWRDIITQHVGVEPVMIDSALVSAQSRKRLYWSNWDFSQPEDKGIILADIVDDVVSDKYLGGYNPAYKSQSNSLHNLKGKSKVIHAGTHGYSLGYIEIQGAAIRNQVTKRGTERQLNIRKDNKSNCVVPTYPNRLNGIVVGMADDIRGYEVVRRIDSPEGKSPSLTTMQGGHRQPKVSLSEKHYRKLTPVECERLQTVPDDWTSGVSDTQRYKMLGNGWTIDVIVHIFKHLPTAPKLDNS